MARVPLIKFRYAAMKTGESVAMHLEALRPKLKFEPTRLWSLGKASAPATKPVERPVSRNANKKPINIAEMVRRAPLSESEMEIIMLGGTVE